jgi:actin-related protein 2
MFGDEATPYRALLEITYPIEEGRVRNWEDFEKLWEYTF